VRINAGGDGFSSSPLERVAVPVITSEPKIRQDSSINCSTRVSVAIGKVIVIRDRVHRRPAAEDAEQEVEPVF
jgi:hypothetical protein